MTRKVIAYVRSDIKEVDEQLKILNDCIIKNDLDIDIIEVNKVTQSGRLKKAKSKGFAGGRVPLGYTLIDSEVLEVDPDEAETIRTIYKLRKEGVSLQKIADHLAAKGIRNKSSKPFSKQAISYITKNPIYSGIYKYDGDKENNDISFKVPCIVSKELWSEVNK